MDDKQLTEHFSLYELTATSHAELQAENRNINDLQISKLGQLAMLLETVRLILEAPITVSSAYRCYALNALVGSNDRSQHMRSEAADIIPKGMDLTLAFTLLRKAAKAGNIRFGQLIYEKAVRPYATEWIHISLGTPYRDETLCGEVLTMNENKYHLIEQIKKEVA